MANQIEVSQIVAMLGSAYPNFSPTKETVGVYYELLKDLPVDLLKASALQCCAESGRKFAPSVGEIRGGAGEITRKAQGVPSALEAWNEVCKAPKSSEYRTLTDEVDEEGRTIIEARQFVWTHPLVERVARLLGWPKFPDWENEGFERAHFLKQYEIELNNHTDDTVELPEVTRYIQTRRNGKALPIGKVAKQLEAGQ